MGCDTQCVVFFFRKRLIKFDHIAHQRGNVEILQRLLDRPRFQFRDQQHGVEGLDDAVGLLERPLKAVAIIVRITTIAQRFLRPVAQSRQRCFEIVRDIVGHLAQPSHELLDTVEHSVEIAPEFVEFIAAAGDRNTPRQIPGHDRLRGRGDPRDAFQNVSASDDPTRQPDNAEKTETGEKNRAHTADKTDLLFHIARNQQLLRPEHHRNANGHALLRLGSVTARIMKQSAGSATQFGRPTAKVSRDLAALVVGKKVKLQLGSLTALGNGLGHRIGALSLGQAPQTVGF